MAKKKVTIVTKKKKSKAAGAADASSPKAGTRKTTAKKAAPKKSDGLLGVLPSLPSLPDLLDFPAGVADTAREVWMAGIGALSTVEEMGAEMFQSLVQKGEYWEQESRKKLTAASKTASDAAQGAKVAAGSLSKKPIEWTSAAETQIQRVVEDSIEGVLHRLNVPTHDEVQDLIGRVAALSGKVDALTQQRAAAEPKQPSASKADKKTSPESASSKRSAPSVPVYHVAPHDEGWAVEKEGSSRATSVHGTKAEAVKAGRERAKSGQTGRLVLHRQDGTIQDTFSYGEDG
ncbi:MAG: phasin family protein [Bacteroidota bacterium]